MTDLLDHWEYVFLGFILGVASLGFIIGTGMVLRG